MNYDPTIRDSHIRLTAYKQSVDTLKSFEKGILKLANSEKATYVFKKPKGFLDNKSEIVFESNRKNLDENKKNQQKALDTYSNLIRHVFQNIPIGDSNQLTYFLDIINNINSNFLEWAGYNVEVYNEQLHIKDLTSDPGAILQKLTKKIEELKAKIDQNKPKINPQSLRAPESFDFVQGVLPNGEQPYQDRRLAAKQSSTQSSVSSLFNNVVRKAGTALEEAGSKVTRTMQNLSIRKSSKTKRSSVDAPLKAAYNAALSKFSIPFNIKINDSKSMKAATEEMVKKDPQNHLDSMSKPPEGTDVNTSFWRDFLRLSLESVHINGEKIDLNNYHNTSSPNAPIELLNKLLVAFGDSKTFRIFSNICHQGNLSVVTGNWVDFQMQQGKNDILLLSDIRTDFENLRSLFKINLEISGDTIIINLKSTMKVINPSKPLDGTQGFGIAFQQITLAKDPENQELTIKNIVDAHSALHLLDYDFEDKSNHERFLKDLQEADKSFESEIESAVKQ